MSVFAENAEVLRTLASNGSDLEKSRPIDFSHVFQDQASAEAFGRAAEREGFSATVMKVEREESPWDVTASVELVPTCEHITEIEEHLGALARMHRGRSDGWGFFRV